ncbi:MAG: PEP-CTERM sorting domain-containing protein [Chromatiales bacterium]|nr:PEP-CTERM sorting domain-containing protein [Chromatiales bacterium]
MKIRIISALGLLVVSVSTLAGNGGAPVSEPNILGLAGAGALAAVLAWRIRHRR